MNIKQLSWIGDISYAQPQGKGEYPGAVCMSFDSVKSFNAYFKAHSQLLVIDVTYIKRWWRTTVVAMVTNQLSPQELNDLQEVSREIEFAMMDRRKARAVAAEQEAIDKAVKVVEEKRLADIGRRYEARVKHMRLLPPNSTRRKEIEAKLNAGDPKVLTGDQGGSKVLVSVGNPLGLPED